jgi:hypothetical protein
MQGHGPLRYVQWHRDGFYCKVRCVHGLWELSGLRRQRVGRDVNRTDHSAEEAVTAR